MFSIPVESSLALSTQTKGFLSQNQYAGQACLVAILYIRLSLNHNLRGRLRRRILHYDSMKLQAQPHVFTAGPLEPRVRWRSSDQAYFLTAFSMAPPALARSSGIMTG